MSSSPTSSTSGRPHSPPPNGSLKRAVSTSSIASYTLDNLPTMQDATINLVPVDHHQTVAQPSRNITAKLAAEIENDPIYNSLTKKVKKALIQGLDDIEETFLQRIQDSQEDQQQTPQHLAYISNQISELQTAINHRFSVLQEEVNELKTAQTQHQEPTTSYATALKNKALKNKFVAIPPKGLPVKKALQKLREVPCPEDCTIKRMSTRPNHIEFTAANQAQSAKLQSHFKDIIPDMRVEDKKVPTIRLIFHNATIHNADTLENVLVDLGFERSEIKVVTSLRSKNENIQHAVIELPKAKTQSILLKNYKPDKPSYILIGLQRLYYKIFIRLTRCRRCQSFTHPTHLCKGPDFCVTCGQEHYDENCQEDPFCVNCSDYNNDIKEGHIHGQKRNAFHPASSSECLTYKERLHELIYNTHSQFVPTEQEDDISHPQKPPRRAPHHQQEDEFPPQQLPPRQFPRNKQGQLPRVVRHDQRLGPRSRSPGPSSRH